MYVTLSRNQFHFITTIKSLRVSHPELLNIYFANLNSSEMVVIIMFNYITRWNTNKTSWITRQWHGWHSSLPMSHFHAFRTVTRYENPFIVWYKWHLLRQTDKWDQWLFFKNRRIFFYTQFKFYLNGFVSFFPWAGLFLSFQRKMVPNAKTNFGDHSQLRIPPIPFAFRLVWWRTEATFARQTRHWSKIPSRYGEDVTHQPTTVTHHPSPTTRQPRVAGGARKTVPDIR